MAVLCSALIPFMNIDIGRLGEEFRGWEGMCEIVARLRRWSSHDGGYEQDIAARAKGVARIVAREG